MASLLDTGICPSCGAVRLRKHCESRTCDWARCTNCQSWGDENGRRWVDGRKKGAGA
jgi:hypothetical protein